MRILGLGKNMKQQHTLKDQECETDLGLRGQIKL